MVSGDVTNGSNVRYIAAVLLGCLWSAGTVAQSPGMYFTGHPYVSGTRAVVKRYGSDRQQALRFFPAEGRTKAPLVVYYPDDIWVDGRRTVGGDVIQPLVALGISVAVIGPGGRTANLFEARERRIGNRGMAHDLATAIAFFATDRSRVEVDTGRVVVIGDGQGAGPAALLGTDLSILREAGIDPDTVKSIVLIAGQGIDGTATMRTAPEWQLKIVRDVFGADPETQIANSAVGHAAAPNVARFFSVPDSRWPQTLTDSVTLRKALSGTGADVRIAVRDAGISSAGKSESGKRAGHPAPPPQMTVEAISRYIVEVLIGPQ